MRPLIGFYVHHHGLGHLTRAATIIGHLDSRAALLTSAETHRVGLPKVEEVVRLPLDTDVCEAADAAMPPLRGLHYAPVGCRGLLERTARVVQWVTERRPQLLVVDVSAEVSLLGRLLGLPVVTVRQHGLRTDPAHLAAYGASHSLLAPYPEDLEQPDLPGWVRERTFYSGGFSRCDDRIGTAPEVPDPPSAVRDDAGRDDAGRNRVCVLLGAGGSALTPDLLARTAAANPGWDWEVLGDLGGETGRPAPSNLHHHRWVADVFEHLRRSDVVVTSGSHNSVMEVAAARRPLVCIPQRRPFREQESKAERLSSMGAAVSVGAWPEPRAWDGVLRGALDLGTEGLTRIVDGAGAPRAARYLDGLARRFGALCP